MTGRAITRFELEEMTRRSAIAGALTSLKTARGAERDWPLATLRLHGFDDERQASKYLRSKRMKAGP
jgi:hypothetical protein